MFILIIVTSKQNNLHEITQTDYIMDNLIFLGCWKISEAANHSFLYFCPLVSIMWADKLSLILIVLNAILILGKAEKCLIHGT